MITIKKEHLKAVSLFAAKASEGRYYLNAVHIESDGKDTRLVATNGHILGMTLIDVELPVLSLIIPLEAVVSALKIKTDEYVITYQDNQEAGADQGMQGTIEAGSQSISFTSINTKYPDINKVIPDSVNNEAACFHPALVETIAKAAKLLKGGEVYIHNNGTGAAIVKLSNYFDFFGVIIPCRDNVNLEMIPHWVKSSPVKL